MTTLTEQMQQRMAERPDANTLAWWDQRFTEQAKATRGIIHAANLVLAEVEDQNDLVKAFQSQVKSLADDLHEAKAAIGRLQAEVTELKGQMQKAREVIGAMRKEAKQ